MLKQGLKLCHVLYSRSLKQMLDQEMDTSSVLRAEIEEMKHTAVVKHEKEQAKLLALQKYSLDLCFFFVFN